MSYIVVGDLTDRLIKPIVTADATYLTRSDAALEDYALSVDVESTEIASPTPYRVKEYLKAWIGWAVCMDLVGVSPKKLVEEGIQEDPYEKKLKYYQDLLVEKKAELTPEVLTGEADDPDEFASATIDLYRA
jgi:hypothetical protein